jgi:cation/acetate symporter
MAVMGDKTSPTDEERARIDGRVAFAASAFVVAAALVILLDRVGVPQRLVAVLSPGLALAGLAGIGFLVRTMRVSGFYAAGRLVPSAYAGLGGAAIASGLWLPFAASPQRFDGLVALSLAGLVGTAWAYLLIAPVLRSAGAFSMADLLSARFPNPMFRLTCVAAIATICGLTFMAGLDSAADGLAQSLAIDRGAGLVLVACVLACITVPGGLSGIAWAAAGAGGVILVGLGLPIALRLMAGIALPAPIFGDQAQWGRAAALLSQWAGPPTALYRVSGLGLLVLVTGLAFLPPLLSNGLGSRDRRSASRAGALAVFWQGVILILGATTLASTVLAIADAGVGKSPELLPAWIYGESGRGSLSICGQFVANAAAAKAACAGSPEFAGRLAAADLAPHGDLLIRSLAAATGLGPAFSGLTAAALAVMATLLAAASLQAFATSIGHDAVYRIRDSGALTSRRLAVTRTILLAGLLGAVALLRLRGIDPRGMIGLALALCAALIAPVFVLALVPRIRAVDATIALAAGLLVLGGFFVLTPVTDFGRLAAVALAAAGLVIGCGIATSFLGRPADRQAAGKAMARWQGEDEWVAPDRGA